MRKAKKLDNQAWMAWLSDDSAGSTPPQSRPVPSSGRSSEGSRPSRSASESPKLSSASAVRIRAQTSMHHRSVQYEAPRAPMKPSSPVVMPAEPATSHRAIDINITLPKITFPKLPHARVAWKRVLRWGGVIVFAAVIIIATPHILQLKAKQADKTTSSSKPAYAPLEPSTKGASVAGAQYDNKRQLYKYDDEYNGASLTISQQPLPDKLRSDPTEVQKLAKSIGANERIETTNGYAYISTDDKTATQRVVVAHRQLLVFIQSSKSMSNAEWVAYIQQLQ